MPVPRQPSAQYQLSSTGIAPWLQLARYCVSLINCPSVNLQPPWYRASTAKIFALLAKYWHSAGIRMAYHRRDSKWYNLDKSCQSVLALYWKSVPCQHWNLYWFMTGIISKSLVSRHLVSGLGLYYASTAPSLGPVLTIH